MLSSHFVAGITVSLTLYTITSFALAVISTGMSNKFIMLAFGLSPFLIGKFASYEKKALFTFLQFLCILLSCVIVFLRIL